MCYIVWLTLAYINNLWLYREYMYICHFNNNKWCKIDAGNPKLNDLLFLDTVQSVNHSHRWYMKIVVISSKGMLGKFNVHKQHANNDNSWRQSVAPSYPEVSGHLHLSTEMAGIEKNCLVTDGLFIFTSSPCLTKINAS